jgi:hypothetical protein
MSSQGPQIQGTQAVDRSQSRRQRNPLPATLIHDLSNLLSEKDTTVGLYSKYPFPNRKDRQLDEFQQQAWDYLSANPAATFSRNEVRNGKHIVRVAVADSMTVQACVNCHNSHPASPKKDWKLGDCEACSRWRRSSTAN